ncbi:MAG: tRNA-dihydrouridine synthase family protein [Candidatus Paceibacterota bacterium]|jgi:nifR3 family TIM-barrel protein
MANIWQKVSSKGVFFCVAPMSDVTDIAFRQIIAKYSRHGKAGGGPDVFWTEFVSADGLASEEGKPHLMHILKYSKNEKPLIAQIFGAKPENIKIACQIIAKLGFDGVDINMGCPDKSVIKQGAGAALINNPKLACEIIRAAKEGAPKLPISVKTRIGYNVIEYKKWLPKILAEKISALTIHLRTKKEMSDVPAHFELAKNIVKVVRANDKKVVLIANGDIENLEQGRRLAKDSGFLGIMIGRGVFGNPWLFDTKVKLENISTKDKLMALIDHIKLYEKLLHHRNYANMKKHFKSYVNGFEGAKELRVKLMGVESLIGAQSIINSYLKSLK